MKKTGEEEFYVPKGCYDWTEVFEPVGCSILSQPNSVMRKEPVKLYRDYGLGTFIT